MMTLYHFPASLNSQKVLLALAEKGLSWDSQVINLALGKQYDPEHIRINPNASVPTLVIGDTVLTDSTDIVDYLYQHYRDDDHGNTVDDQLCHDWMQRIARFDERIFIFGSQQGRKKRKAMNIVSARLDALTQHMLDHPELENLYASKANDMDNLLACIQSDSAVEQVRDYLIKMLNKAEEQLINTSFLAGKDFSAADAMFLPILKRIETLRLKKWIKERPKLAEYYRRCQRRPSYQIAIRRYEKKLARLWSGLSTWCQLRWRKWRGRY